MHNFVLSVFVLGIIWARGDHHNFMLKYAIACFKISKDSFLGKDLTTEKDFLQKVELSLKEQNFEQKTESSYYVGKCCMCLSFQAEYFRSHEDVLKLVVLTEEHFA